jgi:hypothetical protein
MNDKRKDALATNSKSRLKKEVKKKMQTTMIGAVASVEKYFGHLWGHGSDNQSPEQQRMQQIFEDMRTEILDKGNHQIRSIESEIETYDVTWNKYQTSFVIQPLNFN